MRPPAVVLLLLAVLACGCAAGGDADPGAPSASSDSPTAGTATGPPSPSPEPTGPTGSEQPRQSGQSEPSLPPVRDRVSLPAIMREPLNGGRIRGQGLVSETDSYVESSVTYRSDGLTISGELLRPKGPGPFPGVVLNHGYIEPEIYDNGQGLTREQAWLASNGFAVLHTDYRGHASSDDTNPIDMATRLGYTRDAANAVRALAREPYVDGDRMAMLGRSMGGGVTQNAIVAYPELVDAAVVFASVSSDFVENQRRFGEDDPGDSAELRRFYDRFGTPRQSPAFYRGLSSRTYFDRVRSPLLIHHGTSDDTCPIRWSRETHRLLQRAGADSTLAVYQGEEHAFGPQFPESMRRTVRFLRNRLSA